MKLTQSKPITDLWREWHNIVFETYWRIADKINEGMSNHVEVGTPSEMRYKGSWQRRLRSEIGS
jgi:hypothetical protein